MAITIQMKYDPSNHSLKATPTVWPCKACKFLRKHIESFKIKTPEDIVEFDVCGVYLLLSRESVYVGEAEQVITRLKQHTAKPPFDWDVALAFISKEQSLEKSHIKYLEHEIFCLLKKVGNYKIKNTSTPTRSHVSDEDTMQAYLNYIINLTEIFGYANVFIPQQHSESERSTPANETAGRPSERDDSNAVFPFKIGRVMACAFREALSQGLLNNDLVFLESKDACKLFKTRGFKVIVPGETQPQPVHGVSRYSKDPVHLCDKKYWITTQVYKEGLDPLLLYLEQHGMSRDDVIAVCKGEKIEVKNAPDTTSEFSSFRDYLQKTMCKHSAVSYASSFKDLEQILLKAKIISAPLSSDTSSDEIEAIRGFMSSNKAFREYNKAKHHSRSAAWKKFEDYLQAAAPKSQAGTL